MPLNLVLDAAPRVLLECTIQDVAVLPVRHAMQAITRLERVLLDAQHAPLAHSPALRAPHLATAARLETMPPVLAP
jgi:hypothetical protein